jgi:predicted acyltransferase
MEKAFSRLDSLDILRGLTIILMIVVNDPGSWSHVYAPLLHAEWNGLTPTDYVFPSFLFIVGVSIVLSISKQRENGVGQTQILKKVAFRALKIYLVGLFLWLWPAFDFERIRWVGVLPRIAVVFLICAIIYLYTQKKTQTLLLIVLLISYWLIMAYLPIPGIGNPDLSVPEKNWANYLDSQYLPGYLWQKTWDPEGFLSTITAVCTGLLGMLAGHLIIGKLTLQEKLIKIFVLAASLLILGDIAQYIMPVNKSIWSSSFVLITGGISALLLGFFIYWVDVKGQAKHFRFAKVFGLNPIFSYVLAGLLYTVFYSKRLWGFSWSATFMEVAQNVGIAPKLASLTYALIFVCIIWIPTYMLYRKKIIIKL